MNYNSTFLEIFGQELAQKIKPHLILFVQCEAKDSAI